MNECHDSHDNSTMTTLNFGEDYDEGSVADDDECQN